MNKRANWPEHPRALRSSVFAGSQELVRETLTIVAHTIEAERERLRPELGKARTYFQDRGFFPTAMDAVDAIGWEDLIQRREVLQRCAAAAETGVAEILRMVCEHCNPSNPDALFWRGEFYDLPRTIAKALAPHVQGTKANERSIKEGGARGGVKSGRTRRQQSSLPSLKDLRSAADKLIEEGCGQRNVANRLAKRYGVTAKTIRENLKKAPASAALNK